MVKPSFLFLKCFYSQIFNLSNKDRIKFIKNKSDKIDFIFTSLNEEKKIFSYKKFQKKFEYIIDYIILLIQQMDSNDIHFLDKIFFSFNFIINCLKNIVKYERDNINNKEEPHKINKNIENVFIAKKRLQSLLSEENLANFFDIYIPYISKFIDLKN